MFKSQSIYRLLLAECLGTLMLVFAGTGAIIVNDLYGGVITHFGIAATFGLIVLAVIYTYGDTSGAHINPAVTIAFWVARRFPGKWVLPYIASQATGALMASILWKFYFPQHESLGATLPIVGQPQTFIMELILTWWLTTVILGVSEGAKEKGLVAGLVIGGVVALEAVFAGPLTGASMNPARSLGPAVISGQMSGLWIYIVATSLGATLAVFTCRLTKGPECCSNELIVENTSTSNKN